MYAHYTFTISHRKINLATQTGHHHSTNQHELADVPSLNMISLVVDRFDPFHLLLDSGKDLVQFVLVPGESVVSTVDGIVGVGVTGPESETSPEYGQEH